MAQALVLNTEEFKNKKINEYTNREITVQLIQMCLNSIDAKALFTKTGIIYE